MTGQRNRVEAAPLWVRWLVFLLGLWIMTIGIAVSVHAGLGTSPISTIPAVLMAATPLSFGTLTILMNCVFVLLQIALLRREFTRVNYLQFVIAVAFGTLSDASLRLLSFLHPGSYAEQWALVVLGAALVGLGVFIEVLPRLIYVPGEGVVAAVAWRTKWRFGTVKQLFDWTLVIVSVAASLLLLGRLEGVREGTVFAAIAVGGCVKLYARLWGKLAGNNEQ